MTRAFSSRMKMKLSVALLCLTTLHHMEAAPTNTKGDPGLSGSLSDSSNVIPLTSPTQFVPNSELKHQRQNAASHAAGDRFDDGLDTPVDAQPNRDRNIPQQPRNNPNSDYDDDILQPDSASSLRANDDQTADSSPKLSNPTLISNNPDIKGNNRRPQPGINPKLDARNVDNFHDSATGKPAMTLKDSADESESQDTENFNAEGHPSDDQFKFEEGSPEISPKPITPSRTIADANNRALVAKQYSSTTLMSPTSLSTTGKPVTNSNAVDNSDRLDSEASNDDNSEVPIQQDDLGKKQNGNLSETTNAIPPNTLTYISNLVSSTLSPIVKLSPKSTEGPNNIPSTSLTVSSSSLSDSAEGEFGNDDEPDPANDPAAVVTIAKYESPITATAPDQNPASQNLTLPNTIGNGGIPGTTGRDQSAIDSELLRSTKSPESKSLEMTKAGILPTVSNTSDIQNIDVDKFSVRPAHEDDSEDVNVATTDSNFQNVVSSTDTVAELATSSIKQPLTFTEGLKSNAPPQPETGSPKVLPDDTVKETTQSLILSTTASRVPTLSSESAKSSTTTSTLSTITTSTPVTKKGKANTKSTTSSTTLSSTSTKLLSTTKEPSVSKDEKIEHTRKRPVLITEGGREHEPLSDDQSAEAVSQIATDASQTSSDESGSTARNGDLISQVKDMVGQVEPFYIALTVLIMIAVLVPTCCICCKWCSRRRGGIRHRRLKEYGKEKEFLLRERGKASKYSNDSVTLLEGSSEDEF